MAKRVLKLEHNYECHCIGIASSAREYRICHFLDKQLGLAFEASGEMEIKRSQRTSSLFLPRYVCKNEERVASYFLVGNKYNGEYFVKELKNIDYLLIIEGEMLASEYKLLLKELQQIPVVEHFLEFDLKLLKGLEQYIFELPI
jgi:hypothetical protein